MLSALLTHCQSENINPREWDHGKTLGRIMLPSIFVHSKKKKHICPGGGLPSLCHTQLLIIIAFCQKSPFVNRSRTFLSCIVGVGMVPHARHKSSTSILTTNSNAASFLARISFSRVVKVHQDSKTLSIYFKKIL